jgi:hypothetical protein
MNVNPVANAMQMAAGAVAGKAGAPDGDGDHGIEPTGGAAPQPSLPPNSTISQYA